MSHKSQLEVTAFMHQKLEDIRPFLNEHSQIAFYKDDLHKVLDIKEEAGEDIEPFMGCTECYTVKFSEQGQHITSYGLGQSPYEAITNASNELLKILLELQDQSVSNSSRNNDVNSATHQKH